MKLFFKILPAILLFYIFTPYTIAQDFLSQEEKDWLNQNPVLHVSNEMDWAPFDFAIGGVPQGYSIDLLNLVAQRIGLEIEYVNGYSWPELVELFKSDDLDLIHSISKNAERESLHCSQIRLHCIEVTSLSMLTSLRSLKYQC